MGYTCKSSFKITEKNVKIMSNSEYFAHSEHKVYLKLKIYIS